MRLVTDGVGRGGREFHSAESGWPMGTNATPKRAPQEVAVGIAYAGGRRLAIPAGDECRHFKLIGTTGTGKTTAIRELLESAIARGDRAVFADPDAGYRNISTIATAATSFYSIHSSRTPQSGICLRKSKTVSTSISWQTE